MLDRLIADGLLPVMKLPATTRRGTLKLPRERTNRRVLISIADLEALARATETGTGRARWSASSARPFAPGWWPRRQLRASPYPSRRRPCHERSRPLDPAHALERNGGASRRTRTAGRRALRVMLFTKEPFRSPAYRGRSASSRIAAKRGSERRPSNAGSTLSRAICQSRASNAL